MAPRSLAFYTRGIFTAVAQSGCHALPRRVCNSGGVAQRPASTAVSTADSSSSPAGSPSAGYTKRKRQLTPKFRDKFGIVYTPPAPKGALEKLGESVAPKIPISERVFEARLRPLDNNETKLGSRASRRLRRAGLLPGVVYGGGPAALNPRHYVMVETKEVERMIRTFGESLENTVMCMMLDGEEVLVIPRQLAKHPVSEEPQVMNWLRLKGNGISKSNPNGLIRMDIPVDYTDLELSPAIKRGGYVNRVRWKVPCIVQPDKLLGGRAENGTGGNLVHEIPTRLEVSLQGFEVNERVRISNLVFPPGVLPDTKRVEQYDIIANVKGKTVVAETSAESVGGVEVMI